MATAYPNEDNAPPPLNETSLLAVKYGLILFITSLALAQDSAILAKDQPWAPVTSKQRWQIYRDRTYESPGAYFRAFGSALGDQLNDRPASWPQGVEGYSRRLGQRFVTFTMQDSAEAALSAAANYDPRYVRCKCTGWARVGHAFQMTYLTYDGNGKKVFNWPRFAGAYSAGMLSTTWVKDYKWSAQGLRAGNNQLTIGFGFNILREFLPEIRKKFGRK